MLLIQISNWDMHWPENYHLVVDENCSTHLISIWIYHLADENDDGVFVMTHLMRIWIYHLADENDDGVFVMTHLIRIWIYHLADENEDEIWIWTQGI
jgi:hypothetical protein